MLENERVKDRKSLSFRWNISSFLKFSRFMRKGLLTSCRIWKFINSPCDVTKLIVMYFILHMQLNLGITFPTQIKLCMQPQLYKQQTCAWRAYRSCIIFRYKLLHFTRSSTGKFWTFAKNLESELRKPLPCHFLLLDA